MAKTSRIEQCAHNGCREITLWEFSSRADERKHQFGKWLCSRHRKPDEILSTERLEISHSETVQKAKYPGLRALFWNGTSGIVNGPGMKAFASDFPEGTRLEITYRIVLPEEGLEV